MAYQDYKTLFQSDRFLTLAAHGASVQRLLWASTSTKNPHYPDVKYAEALIGPDTVNTMPLETLNAYRGHGDPQPRIEQDVGEARLVLNRLPEIEIDINKVTQQLEDEGIVKFNTPFDQLLEAIGNRITGRSPSVFVGGDRQKLIGGSRRRR